MGEQVRQIPNDLSKYILRDVHLYHQLGWAEFIRQRRGIGDIGDLRIQHPARRLLQHLKSNGIPVIMTTPRWSPQHLQQAIDRGPHRSAHEHHDFLRSEMAEMVQKQQWIVLPYEAVKDIPTLRLSPIGVVPQRDRRPRIIVDYSWYNVNQETLSIAPDEAMQFGQTLPRLLVDIVNSDPQHGPVYMMKADVDDGYYRKWLRVDDIPKLGVIIPGENGQPLVAFPLVLPMGWVSSAPYFCSSTETITDVTNRRILQNDQPPPHRLEDAANTPPSGSEYPALPTNSTHDNLVHPRIANRRPLGRFDVYVDDFIGIAQGNTTRLNRLRRILFDTIDRVFRPLERTDSPHRREPISVKKLLRGEAYWDTVKLVLGWIVNTVTMTLTLPPHRCERLHTILDEFPLHQRRTSKRKWHQFIGELRSMVLGIPGARGLFSHLQAALDTATPKGRMRLSRHVHATVQDFRWLASTLSERPTRLYELVAQEPAIHGAHDAARYGMGGVIFPPPQHMWRNTKAAGHPIVWRERFPPDVANDLVTSDNLTGRITNSDLELAGSLAQHDITAHHYDVRERTTHHATDNINTYSWQRRGSVSTNDVPAYLLRLQALHQRFHRYLPQPSFLPGTANGMADDASRLWALSDRQLLTYFNSTYPQRQSWKLCRLPMLTRSALISSLRRRRPAPESFLRAPPPLKTTGNIGETSASASAWIHPSRKSATQSYSSRYLHNITARASLHPRVTQSDLAQLRMPCAPLAKRSLCWGPRTPA
jgi:hypothetical protein